MKTSKLSFKNIKNYSLRLLESWLIRLRISKIYGSIDELPMQIFLRVQETNNPSHLIVRGYFLSETVKDTWYKIRDERIRNNDFSDDYFRLFELKLRYLKKISRFLQKPDDRFLEQEIDMLEMDIKRLESSTEESASFSEVMGWLVVDNNINLDLEKVSVKYFDSVLNRATKLAKQRAKKSGTK